MNTPNQKKYSLTFLSILTTCVLLSACARTQQTTVEEVTVTGPDCVETHVTQIKRAKNGRLKVKEQDYYEKIKCVDKHGRNIKANSPEQCLKKGGKIIDKVITQDTKRS